MTVQEFIDDMNGIVGVVEEGLSTAEGLDPAIELPAEMAFAILPVVEKLVVSAVTAWSNASGQPITLETVTALLPDATPLDLPPA